MVDGREMRVLKASTGATLVAAGIVASTLTTTTKTTKTTAG